MSTDDHEPEPGPTPLQGSEPPLEAEPSEEAEDHAEPAAAQSARFGPPDADQGGFGNATKPYESVFGQSSPPGAPAAPSFVPGGVIPAQRQVIYPAIALIVANALGMVGSIYSLLNLLGSGPSAPQSYGTYGAQFVEIGQYNSFMLAQSGMSIALGAFCIFGLIKMQSLKHYELSLTAVILSMVPGLQPCCCIGTFVGIWPLVVLMRADVREAFLQSRTSLSSR